VDIYRSSGLGEDHSGIIGRSRAIARGAGPIFERMFWRGPLLLGTHHVFQRSTLRDETMPIFSVEKRPSVSLDYRARKMAEIEGGRGNESLAKKNGAMGSRLTKGQDAGEGSHDFPGDCMAHRIMHRKRRLL